VLGLSFGDAIRPVVIRDGGSERKDGADREASVGGWLGCQRALGGGGALAHSDHAVTGALMREILLKVGGAGEGSFVMLSDSAVFDQSTVSWTAAPGA
jgi:hypothetical protein